VTSSRSLAEENKKRQRKKAEPAAAAGRPRDGKFPSLQRDSRVSRLRSGAFGDKKNYGGKPSGRADPGRLVRPVKEFGS
jgi:hypothetical protein